MANPLGDSPAASANPLGDSAVVGNPLGDQSPETNPVGDAPASGATAELSPLGQLIEKAKQNPNSGDLMQVAKFALLHPIDYAKGTWEAAKAVEQATPKARKQVSEELSKPNISLPRLDEKQPGLAGVGAGIVNAGEKTLEGLTAPANEPILVGGAALAPLAAVSTAAAFTLRGLAAYFSGSMLWSAGKGAHTAGEMIGEKIVHPEIPITGGQIAEAVTEPVLTAAMGAAAGKVALTPGPRPVARQLPVSSSTVDALGYLDLKRTDAVQQWVATDNPAKTMVYAKDAVNSATERAANTAANDVLADLSSKFNKEELPQARKAMVPAVESGLDPIALQGMRDKLTTANITNPDAVTAAKEMVDSIDFALARLDDLRPAVTKHQAITSAIYQHAQDSGIEFPYRDNYVLHAQDFTAPEGFEAAARGAGGAMAFKKMREFDTYADSIAANVAPKTTDGVDLLRTSVRATQGAVNRNLWSDALQGMKDPKNQQPLVVPRTSVTRPDGTTYLDTPAGYSPTEIGGRPMAIQNGYAGLFDALTDPSKVDPTLSKINATAKSVMLAIDTYHLGRLAYYQAASELSRGEVPVPTYQHGLLLGDMPMPAIEDMARRGEINAQDLPQIRQDKAIIDMGVNHGLNVGRIADSLHQEWIQQVPIIGQVNKFIFHQFQRGAIYDMFTREFRYQQAEHPELTNEQVARTVAKDVNTRLGNIGSQGIFKSNTAKDIARLVILAPQWIEALIRSEVGAVGELATAVLQALKTNRFTPGLLGRTAAALTLGGFTANQVINLMTRGKPTWENPEEGFGTKISAWVPDFVGKGPGFFLNPTTLPFEVSHLLMKSFERTGDWRDAIESYLRGRLSAIGRVPADILSKHDAMGRPLTTLGTVADAVPLPIAGSAAFAAAKQVVTGEHSEVFAGQFEKQALASAGIRLDQALSHEQRIQALASDFAKERGREPWQGPPGEYSDLNRYLRLDNHSAAEQALDDLLKTKKPKDVDEYYRTMIHHPFTGKKQWEAPFYSKLTAEEKTVYSQAVRERAAIAQKGRQLLRQHLMTAGKP
jgi:hypothetical protein